MNDALPRRLRSYRFERILGQGGMGIVHLAYDERLQRRVAIKRVLAGGKDPRRRQRLRREARTAAQLTHPSIVQIFDLIEAEDGDWIVMEWVEGTLLAEITRTELPGIDRVLEIGRQIAEGLAAAHSLGIVHRDLKTENVVMLPDGRIKILDFGLAKRLVTTSEAPLVSSMDGALSQPGQLLGTGRAMSPEQAQGKAVAPRSDLFSLGVLLYEISTGVSPFRGDSLFETLTRVVTHQPPPVIDLVPGLPLALSELVDRLLSKAPELRPASAQVVADELVRIGEDRSFVSRDPAESRDADTRETLVGGTLDGELSPPTIAGAERKGWPARRGRWLAVIGLGLVVVVLFLGLSIGAKRSERVAPPSVDEESIAMDSVLGDPASRDPVRWYEEGMRAARRIDQPKSIDRAIEIFQGMLEADPLSAAAHAGLARAYWEKARGAATSGDQVFLEQAEAIARDAVRLDPYLADAHVSLGLASLLQGHREVAKRELDAALDLDPANADAHFGLGKVAASEGQSSSAEAHFRRAFELRPANLYANALGALLYGVGRYDDAESWFLASLELAPDDLYASRNLGGLYYAQGREDEAASQFQAALRVRPDASLYSNLGTIFFGRGLYPKAAAAFEDALAMPGATNKWVFWLNLADAFRQMPGKEEEMRTSYRRGLRLLDAEIEAAPEDVRLSSRRALALARLGDLETACSEVTRIRASGPVKEAYSLLRLATTDELCGERQRSLAALARALRSGLALSEVQREPDLLDVRADRRFHDLLMELEEAAAEH